VAAITALPHPAKVSQKVPMTSATYFLLFIWFSQIVSIHRSTTGCATIEA
jgi:hypothetical protein